MKRFLIITLLGFHVVIVFGQSSYQNVYSKFVLYNERIKLDRFLREQTIQNTFSLALDSNTEYKYEGTCRAISQFLIDGEDVRNGLRKMFAHYDGLQVETKRSFLEAIYALSPDDFGAEVEKIISNENDPKLFSMCAVYLARAKKVSTASILIQLAERFPEFDSCDILQALQKYLNDFEKWKQKTTPDINSLLAYRVPMPGKNVFSFQRWNRDYPGMAIVQNADGNFVRGSDGRLLVFQQLARSGSDLPYFLTNGSTPQGAYRITSVASVRNNLIGPSPTLQLLMPFEGRWEIYLHLNQGAIWDSTVEVDAQYLKLFPDTWRNYEPMREVFNAGKIGRTEVIAHGTTIDPIYFKAKQFYPLCPTQGCLCAREEWNVTTGKPIFSEQLGLVSAFQSAIGEAGYLYVINLDDQQKPVTREEIEKLISNFEKSKQRK